MNEIIAAVIFGACLGAAIAGIGFWILIFKTDPLNALGKRR